MSSAVLSERIGLPLIFDPSHDAVIELLHNGRKDTAALPIERDGAQGEGICNGDGCQSGIGLENILLNRGDGNSFSAADQAGADIAFTFKDAVHFNAGLLEQAITKNAEGQPLGQVDVGLMFDLLQGDALSAGQVGVLADTQA